MLRLWELRMREEPLNGRKGKDTSPNEHTGHRTRTNRARMTYNPKERQEMPILSKGKRPYIVKMPNEPNPLGKYEEQGIYEFLGGR